MIDFLLLLLLMTGGTWLLGWWAILVIAAGWGWWWRDRKPAWRPSLAAGLAWAFWLSLAGPPAALLTLLDRLDRIFGAPSPVLLALPPLYAALMGWAAARLVQGIAPSPGTKVRVQPGTKVPAQPTDASP
jgi:hypothetical protein